MLQLDRSPRATFHAIALRDDVTPTARDIRWFKHLERHGPLSSSELIAWTSDTHRCKDTSLRRLQALRAARYLTLPQQQRKTERAEFKPYVYDLAPRAKQYLQDAGLAEATVRPTGHWWHLHETAMLTAQIDREARQRGFQYIPSHAILERAGSTLAIPMGRQKLIPDQLFAIDYGGLFRAFMVEVDRGTEPVASTSTRKSWKSALALYQTAFEQGLPNRHYVLKAPIRVLWQLSTLARRGAFEALLGDTPVRHAARHVPLDGNGGQTAAIWDIG